MTVGREYAYMTNIFGRLIISDCFTFSNLGFTKVNQTQIL
jgi:hypothetical protein